MNNVIMVDRVKTRGFLQALVTPTYNSHLRAGRLQVVAAHSLWLIHDVAWSLENSVLIGLHKVLNKAYVRLFPKDYMWSCGFYGFRCGWCKNFPDNDDCDGCFWVWVR